MFNDVEERHRLIFGFGELDGMAKHADRLSAVLQALAADVKAKSKTIKSKVKMVNSTFDLYVIHVHE